MQADGKSASQPETKKMSSGLATGQVFANDCVPSNITRIHSSDVWKEWYLFASLCVTAILCLRRWCRTEFAMLFSLMMVLSAKIISVEEALEGFANPGIMTAVLMNVITEGLLATGGVDYLVYKWMGHPKSIRVALLRIMIPVALVSGFVTNTSMVALMIPKVQTWSKEIGIPPSVLMIPLSVAAVVGGTATLIGSPSKCVLRLKKKHRVLFENQTKKSIHHELMRVGKTLVWPLQVYQEVECAKFKACLIGLPQPSRPQCFQSYFQLRLPQSFCQTCGNISEDVK